MAAANPPGRATRAVLGILGAYQRWVSPWLPGACRFWPTCSEYARLALLRHGLVRGGALAAWRLLRCQRFARGGIDPPPPSAGAPRRRPESGRRRRASN